MSTEPTAGRISNARIVDRGARTYPTVPRKPRDMVRFSARMANSLLLLELGAHHKIDDGWDGEWFEAEFLVRLRAAVAAEPQITDAWGDNFDREAGMRQYETIDLNTIRFISRTRYRAILLSVLRSIYDEEGLGGPITSVMRQAFRLPNF
ncbi:MAG: hypothetical protein M3O61_04730 [Gemmatimonadota bacterium]|nr:hypothetical protein [Gemmatimonadota bacterium]